MLKLLRYSAVGIVAGFLVGALFSFVVSEIGGIWSSVFIGLILALVTGLFLMIGSAKIYGADDDGCAFGVLGGIAAAAWSPTLFLLVNSTIGVSLGSKTFCTVYGLSVAIMCFGATTIFDWWKRLHRLVR